MDHCGDRDTTRVFIDLDVEDTVCFGVECAFLLDPSFILFFLQWSDSNSDYDQFGGFETVMCIQSSCFSVFMSRSNRSQYRLI